MAPRRALLTACVVALGACSTGGSSTDTAATAPAAATAFPTTVATDVPAGSTPPSSTAAPETTSTATGDTEPSATVTPDTGTPDTGGATLPDATEPRTGSVTSCDEGDELIDLDDDGWGACAPIAGPTTSIDPVAAGDFQVVLFGRELVAPERLAEELRLATFAVHDIDFATLDLPPEPPPTATLVITVSTGYRGIAFRDLVATDVLASLSRHWAPGGPFRNEVGTLKPALQLTIDTTVYRASMEQMIELADGTVSPQDFASSTRQ